MASKRSPRSAAGSPRRRSPTRKRARAESACASAAAVAARTASGGDLDAAERRALAQEAEAEVARPAEELQRARALQRLERGLDPGHEALIDGVIGLGEGADLQGARHAIHDQVKAGVAERLWAPVSARGGHEDPAQRRQRPARLEAPRGRSEVALDLPARGDAALIGVQLQQQRAGGAREAGAQRRERLDQRGVGHEAVLDRDEAVALGGEEAHLPARAHLEAQAPPVAPILGRGDQLQGGRRGRRGAGEGIEGGGGGPGPGQRGGGLPELAAATARRERAVGGLARGVRERQRVDLSARERAPLLDDAHPRALAGEGAAHKDHAAVRQAPHALAAKGEALDQDLGGGHRRLSTSSPSRRSMGLSGITTPTRS
jgi:hypothetical protein